MENIKKILLMNILTISGLCISILPMKTMASVTPNDVLPNPISPTEIVDNGLTSQVGPIQVAPINQMLKNSSTSVPNKNMIIWMILTVAILIIDMFAIFLLFKGRRKNYQDFELMM